MNLVNGTRAWLRLFRAHTAVLEAPMAVLGAAIGLGTFFDYRVGLWLIFGVMYHFVGYGMNSYVDWDKGFDKEDERKQHHPLNTGEIKPDNAKKVIGVSFILLFAYLAYLTHSSYVGLGLTCLMVVSGVAYNYFGKYTSLKAVPIAVAHTLVFFIPYYMYTDSITLFSVLMTTAYFIHHIYQIAISGDIKDVDQDEASLIQKLGASIHRDFEKDIDVFTSSGKILIIAYTLTVLQMAFSFGSMYSARDSIYPVALGGVFAALTFYDTDNMLQPGKFRRNKRIEYMSRREFFGYSMVHTAAIPVIGWKAYGLLLISMLVYLGTVSKFIWGNWLVPEV